MQTIKTNHSHDIQIHSPHCGRSYFVSSYAFILDSVCKAVKKTCVFLSVYLNPIVNISVSSSRSRSRTTTTSSTLRAMHFGTLEKSSIAIHRRHSHIYTAHCNLYAFFRIHCWFLVEKGNLCYPRTRVLLFVQREFVGVKKREWDGSTVISSSCTIDPYMNIIHVRVFFFLVLGCIQQCAQRTCIFQLLLSESRWLASPNFHCFTPKNATAHTRQSHNVTILSTVRMAVRKSCRNFIMCVLQGRMYAALFWCKQWKAKSRYAVWYIS